MAEQKTVICGICGKQKRLNETVPGELVRPAVAERIRKEHPDWSEEKYICGADLYRYRAEYVQGILEDERGELSALDKQVVESLKQEELLSRNVDHEFDRQLTIGEKISDRVASFGGSWKFIIMFGIILAVWITVNSVSLLRKPFDPFPYILMNLILSCVAALQAPVIMMSQNRQEDRDRMRSENDYRVNLKAELEIRNLHDKIDFLLTNQWQRLLEIQQIQIEMFEEHLKKTEEKTGIKSAEKES